MLNKCLFFTCHHVLILHEEALLAKKSYLRGRSDEALGDELNKLQSLSYEHLDWLKFPCLTSWNLCFQWPPDTVGYMDVVVWLYSISSEAKQGFLRIYLICKWINAHYCSVAYICIFLRANRRWHPGSMNSPPSKATQQTELQMGGFPKCYDAMFVYRKVYIIPKPWWRRCDILAFVSL